MPTEREAPGDDHGEGELQVAERRRHGHRRGGRHAVQRIQSRKAEKADAAEHRHVVRDRRHPQTRHAGESATNTPSAV